MTRQTEEINVLILKYNRNFERLIEHTTPKGRENCVGNGGVKEMWNGHVMLVEKTEGKRLKYSRI